MMKIAVVDVAADSGGAVSVLLDFLNFIQSDNEFCRYQEWIVYTSMPVEIATSNCQNVVIPEIKKSWVHRLYWEQTQAKKEFIEKKVDFVISLQNTAFKKGNYKQIVYFHNVLLLAEAGKYSLLKAAERKYAVYTKLIAPYTLRSLRNADYVIAQTETVKRDLLRKESKLNVAVIRPNVHIGEQYKGTAEFPIQGLIYPTSAVPFKRVEEIVECVRTNHNWFQRNEFKILITLSGEENEYAKSIKDKANGLLDVIQLIGFLKRDELLDLYKNYGLFTCSELESFSIPFIEAAFVGAPIVAAKYPYAEERIKGVNYAYLYESGDIKGLMKRLETVLKLKERKNNRIDFSENTWEQVIPLLRR